MARIEGVDPKQTSFPMRQVFKKARKMLGRGLTPQKITARVPRVFWVTVLTEWLPGQKAKFPKGCVRWCCYARRRASGPF